MRSTRIITYTQKTSARWWSEFGSRCQITVAHDKQELHKDYIRCNSAYLGRIRLMSAPIVKRAPGKGLEPLRAKGPLACLSFQSRPSFQSLISRPAR